MAKLIYDNFPDVFAFRNAIQTRPAHGRKQSSMDSDSDFAGMPYTDAVSALTDGIPEAAEKLKRELTRFKAKVSGQITQRRPINYYNGHSPNVPAAIIGLPKSMRKVVKTPAKVKTVTLFYNSSANGGTSADTLEKAGACVLQLTYWLELNGYRVKFVLCPYAAECGDEIAICNVLLKEYKQPLDVLKLSFSITSVSMFRRLGFRWMETQPDRKRDWTSEGYGRQLGKDTALEWIQKSGQNTDNAYFINVKDCRNNEFNAVKLAENLGIKVG